MTADFSGYATRSDVRCSDGRTILADAFAHQNGDTVPLVWQHGHDEVTNVLGHVKLESVADGVRAHAYFNQTPEAQHAKEMVRHGDVKFLSIFANQLNERAKQVMKGMIREVSLVLAGANPGATIDNIAFTHSDGELDVDYGEAKITTGLEIEIAHADATATVDKPTTDNTTGDAVDTTQIDDQTLADIIDTMNDDQRMALSFLLSQALTVEPEVQHSDTDNNDADAGNDGADDTDVVVEVDVVADANTDVDSNASGDADANADADSDADTSGDADSDAVGDADANADADSDADTSGDADSDTSDSDSDDDSSSDADSDTNSEAGDDAVQHDNTNQEDKSMSHNVFDQDKQGGAAGHQQHTLTHDDIKAIALDTIKKGSMKTAIEDYALAHGIENIEYLFPDPKTIQDSPNFLSRNIEWVDAVINGVRKTPFSRIRTLTADITADEARARGYIRGNLKNEEFFVMLKRDTTPQTVYKKQKLDRDDVLDITDLDVIAWVKAEMQIMLSEEIAGAILIGDGRSSGDEDKIKEDKIRPIASDDELYVTTVNVNLDDASSSIEELVDAVIANRKYYKGTGTPNFYTSEDIIGKFLTVKDSFGRRIYTSLADVATALRVGEVVSVEVFTRDPSLVGLLVNLTDYSIGTDRGGQATMFDDFDLDYNKLRYLLETRICGALTMPKSAIAFRKVAGTDVILPEPPAPTFVDNVVTVPTVTHVVYKNAAGTTLTTGAPTTLAEGDTLDVQAFPATGYDFPDDANDQWHYEYQA